MPVRPVSVGERIKRREDPRLIRGLASYTDDLKLHGGLYAAFVRSDYAAGRIESIDTSRARSRPGVVAVYTFDDLRGTVGRTPCVARPDAGRDAEHPLLADGRVRWVGQPIAVVVAEDRYLARDAALDVAVEISPTPAVVDPRAALAHYRPYAFRQPQFDMANTLRATSAHLDLPLPHHEYFDVLYHFARARRWKGALSPAHAMQGLESLHTEAQVV